MDLDCTNYNLKELSLLVSKTATQRIIDKWRSKLKVLQQEIEQDKNFEPSESVESIITTWLVIAISNYICTIGQNISRHKQKNLNHKHLQGCSEIVLNFPKLTPRSRIKIYTFVWNQFGSSGPTIFLDDKTGSLYVLDTDLPIWDTSLIEILHEPKLLYQSESLSDKFFDRPLTESEKDEVRKEKEKRREWEKKFKEQDEKNEINKIGICTIRGVIYPSYEKPEKDGSWLLIFNQRKNGRIKRSNLGLYRTNRKAIMAAIEASPGSLYIGLDDVIWYQNSNDKIKLEDLIKIVRQTHVLPTGVLRQHFMGLQENSPILPDEYYSISWSNFKLDDPLIKITNLKECPSCDEEVPHDCYINCPKCNGWSGLYRPTKSKILRKDARYCSSCNMYLCESHFKIHDHSDSKKWMVRI